MTDQQKLDKWKRWLGNGETPGTITNELVDLALIREVFAGVREMVQNNPKLQQRSAFHFVFSRNYRDTVLMHIRRQVIPNVDSIGLIMLACDIHENCHLITQDYYASLYTQMAADERDRVERDEWGRSVFLKNFGGVVGARLDPAIIKQDIDGLKAIADASSDFIDRRVAHLDRRDPNTIPTYPDLDKWCDALNTILIKYKSLLDASDFIVTPVLTHDWKAIFRTAWL